MFSRVLTQLRAFSTKSKRVVNIPKVKLQSPQQANKPEQIKESVFIDTKKIGWQNMDLTQLSSLKEEEIKQIKYSLKKFKTNTSISNQLSTSQQDKLKQHLKNPYYYLTNHISHPKIQPKEIVQLYDFNLTMSNEPLISLIQTVYKNINKPTTLYGKMQTSFIQYLIALGNDLKRVGRELKSIDVKVKQIAPVELKYQFCVDVNKNRSKNESIEKYIITEQSIINPNTSLLMKQHHGKQITFKNIIKKRRADNYKSVLRINSLLEVLFEDGSFHYVKIQFEGPQTKSSLNIQYPQAPEYQIIDIDGVMNGNPSIKSPFIFN